jgi:histidinol phosphatase-like enzyme
LKYAVGYLTKQLAEACKIRDHHAKMLSAHPDDVALQIVASSMVGHVAEIGRDLEEARRAESKPAATPNVARGIIVEPQKAAAAKKRPAIKIMAEAARGQKALKSK